MALPNGYTKTDYIQSDGTQYINTGFTPNQDTRFVVDFEVTSAEGSSGLCIIGSRTNYNSNNLSFVWDLASSWWIRNYGTLHTDKYTATSPVGRHSVDANKTSVTFDGTSTTAASATFTCPGNLYLFAMNGAGTATFFIKAKLYSCKIYDNGTLVRDFIPCINSSGAFGLWDDVNSVFYTNAGSGAFASGKHHRTLINGTGYDIKSGRTLINGTGYDIKKGRTLINGTGYDISFGAPVSELDVGTNVYMNVNGVRKKWLVVHQGNPDAAIYDASCEGTWVMMESPYENRVWDSTDNDYKNADIHTHLNSTFLGLLDSSIQRIVKQVKIPYVDGTGYYTNTVSSGANGLTAKVFLLSYYEVGYNESPSDLQWVDGAKLDYFLAGTTSDANLRRTAWDEEGSSVPWVLRSPAWNTTKNVYGTRQFSDYYTTACTNSLGMRPALVLPFNAMFNDDFDIL